jgi:hypothetical protein
MFADLGRFMPQEFTNKEQCLQWLKDKQLGIRRSITLLGKESDQLTVRTPITNENVRIVGEPNEIAWLHLQMVRERMYTIR